ncbi:MAG: AlpA family transcriptional regulator [Parvibaculum sp.]
MGPKILRRREVESLTGKSRSSLYRDMSAGTFPRPIKLGEKSVGWIESEILAWQQERIAERDGAAAA